MLLNQNRQPVPPDSSNPFILSSESAYQRWREKRLERRASSVSDLVVPVADPANPTMQERAAIIERCRYNNMAVYETRANVDKSTIQQLGRQFGLSELDGNLCSDEDNISALQVSEAGRKREYIPYSNKQLSWHTDGYYNAADRQIRGFILHCVNQAASGGESHVLDHEIVYLLMRDENPAWVAALMAADAMTIPPNVENGVELRGAETGPIFSFDEATRSLHMRYSARMRNIIWKDDPATREAVEFLRLIWQEGSPYIYHHRLMPGQGLICNNILHSRSGFEDDAASGQTRLLYRARYYNRIENTGFDDRD